MARKSACLQLSWTRFKLHYTTLHHQPQVKKSYSMLTATCKT